MYSLALTAMLLSLWYGSATANAATAPRPFTATSSLLRSYPPGDLKLYHFPGNQPGNVVFTPDGSAYSLVRDGLLRIAPDGTKSFVGGASIYGGGSVNNRIVYSNGFLWYQVHQGLVRVHPDGTDPRYLQLPSALGQRQLLNFTAGADGIYYTYYNTTASASGVALEGPVLASISTSFVKTVYPLVAPTAILRDGYYYGPSVGIIVYGPDANVHFEYNNLPGKPLSLDFYVSEPIKSGPWTAVSLNPSVATVTPDSSTVGRFSVTESGHGTTSIQVTDVYGNVQYLPVTAN